MLSQEQIDLRDYAEKVKTWSMETLESIEKAERTLLDFSNVSAEAKAELQSEIDAKIEIRKGEEPKAPDVVKIA